MLRQTDEKVLLLEKIIEMWLNTPEGNIDMGTWCSTTCCLAGHIHQAGIIHFPMIESIKNNTYDLNYNDIEDISTTCYKVFGKKLGPDMLKAFYMFHWDHYPNKQDVLDKLQELHANTCAGVYA